MASDFVLSAEWAKGNVDFYRIPDSPPPEWSLIFNLYIPNLLVVELLARTNRYRISPFFSLAASLMLLFATAFMVIGTYYFTLYYWGPAITNWVSGP